MSEKEQKKIEDYLYLYLGCDVDMSFATTKYKNGITKLTTNILADYMPTSVKPILRPLSDMTSEETMKLSYRQYKNKKWSGVILDNAI